MERILKVAGATVNQTPIDWKGNLANITDAIEEARKQKIDILCFPELAITGYGCEDLFLSEWVPEKALNILEEIIPYCIDISVAIGLPIRIEHKTYNCVAVITNKELVGITAKQNLAIDGVHYEFRWFTPWPRYTKTTIEVRGKDVEIGDIIYDIKSVKVGFEICEDAWIADRPAGRLIERSVELILNPSASHFAFGKSEQREQLIKDSSNKYNCAYVYVNLLGNEAGRMIYDGEVLVTQKGKLLAHNELLSFKDYNIVSTELNFDTAPEKSIIPPFDNKNQEFAQAVGLALQDYMRKSKSKGFVRSLSGGADSSTCAVLVAHMVKLGIEEHGVRNFLNRINRSDIDTTGLDKTEALKKIISQILVCAYQSTKNSGPQTLSAAKSLADSLGATFYHWELGSIVDDYTHTIENALGRKLSWNSDDIALQNIQARSRSPIIWMLANIKNYLLITTSNRSEGDVGYATMDGDTSGSIAPISAVDKPFIRQWLKWAEKELGYNGLKEVNQLAPTAELRPSDQSQTDEDDLMPYDIMVAIERLAIGQHLSPKEVYERLSNTELSSSTLLKEYVRKFYRLWTRNQWKRERIAPAFHLDEFNVDPKTWCRFPILSSGFDEELEQL